MILDKAMEQEFEKTILMFDEFASVLDGINTKTIFSLMFDKLRKKDEKEEELELFESPSQARDRNDLK